MVELAFDERTLLLGILYRLPVLGNERGREAVLITAGLEKLLPLLDLSGQATLALPLLLRTLSSYGKVESGHEALGQFLSAVKVHAGNEEQPLIEGIINKYSLMIPSAASDSRFKWLQPITAQEVTEKIIGEMSLRPIAFLQQGLIASRAVTYIEVARNGQRWSGTGFMLSEELLLTCHHVVDDEDLLPNTIVRFNFQLTFAGSPELYQDFIPVEMISTNPTLDYALLKIKDSPGTHWGCLHIATQIPNSGSRVNIIQHPNGLPKQISIQNNFVKYSDKTKIQYVTSTMPGSSGSPVLNDKWEVVGLHRAGGWLPEASSEQVYFRNEGTTLTSIIDDLPASIRNKLQIN